MTSRTFHHFHALLPLLAIAIVLQVTSASAQSPANSDALRRQIEELTSKPALNTKPTDEKPSIAGSTTTNPDTKKLCIKPSNPASDPVVNAGLSQLLHGTKLQPELLTASLPVAQIEEIKTRECAFVLEVQITSSQGGNNGALLSQVPAGLGAIPGMGQAGGSVMGGIGAAGAILGRLSKPRMTAVFTLSDAASHKLIEGQKATVPAQDFDAANKLLTAVATAVVQATQGK